MDTPQETFEPVKIAASRIGIPASWLKSEAEAGRLPAIRVGKRLLFNVEQVERALLAKAEVAQ
jgi:excisionase family DNA binding protein